MHNKLRWGFGLTILSGILMGVSYWQVNVQADTLAINNSSLQTSNYLFLIGIILAVIAVIFFVLAALSKK